MSKFVKAREIQKGDLIQVGGVWCRCNDTFPANDDTVVIMFVYTPFAGHLVIANDFPIQRIFYSGGE